MDQRFFREGYAPDYYVGKLATSHVENVLKGQGHVGSFVVRESASRPGQWSLTIKISTNENCIAHYSLVKEDHAIYLPDAPHQKFHSLEELITQHANLCIHSAGGLFRNSQAPPALQKSNTAYSNMSTQNNETPAYLEIDLNVPSYIRNPKGSEELYIESSAAKRAFNACRSSLKKVAKPNGISATALMVIKEDLITNYPEAYWTLKTWEVNDLYTKPLTIDLPDPVGDSICKNFLNFTERNRDRFSRYESRPPQPPVAPATVFVSHAWSYPFAQVVEVMLRYASEQQHETYFWYDMFTNSQHSCEERPYEWWQDTFQSSIGVIGHVLLVMMPWNTPKPMSRAWCLFEILCAIVEKTDLKIGMPIEEEQLLVQSLSTGDSQILAHLGHVDSRNAEASNADDKDKIFNVIRQTVGFDGINDLVKEHLRNWIIHTAEIYATKIDSSMGLELLTSMAKLCHRFGKTDLSLSLYERRLISARVNFHESHPTVGQAWANLGAIYFDLQEYDKALESSQKALAIFESHKDDATLNESGLMERNKDISMTYINLGHSYKRTRQLEKAKDCYSRAENIAKTLSLQHGATVEIKKTFANASSAVGNMLRTFGHPRQACQRHAEALKMKHQLGLIEELSTAVIYHNKALAHRDLKEWDTAAEDLKSALVIRRTILGSTHNDTVSTKHVLEEVQKQIDLVRRSLKRGGSNSSTMVTVNLDFN
eukprot:m.186589 g.186589  ORF g.186589 m.186589 type:complete len:711 (-) comp32274_c0_seq1:432-2564(-)